MLFGIRNVPAARPIMRISAVLLSLALVFLPACFAKKDFMKAQELDTPEAYQAFLKKHHDDKKYSKKAETRLEELRFDEVCKIDTYAAYMEFLTEYPVGVGTLSRRAEIKAEDIRAKDLGIHIYRKLPQDYAGVVTARGLPYRLGIRSSDPQGSTSSSELESKWYFELKRWDLFVPMDPKLSYPVSPDLVLDVRQSVVYLCQYPIGLVRADVWAGGNKVKEYSVAALQRPDLVLIYEIFKDREIYDSILAVPDKEKKAVSERFDRLRKHLPMAGSVALEVDFPQDAYLWDRDLSVDFAEFLNELGPYQRFSAYRRGQPPDRIDKRPIYFRVDPEIHSPCVREQWSAIGPAVYWNRWNSKWIMSDRDFFFKKMTLDIVDFLSADEHRTPRRDGETGDSLVIW